MDNYPFYELIATFVFVIAALISIIIGILRKTIVGWIIGISILLVLLLYTLIANPNMSIALSAFSTIALTIFAGLTLFINLQLRKNAKDKEDRDRKERLFNEIIEWAKKSAESAIYRQKTDNHELWNAKLNYKNCRAVSEYIKEIAASSFSTLSSHIDEVATKLDDAIDGTTQYIESKLSDNHDRMRGCEEELTNAVIELFKEVAKTKKEL